MVSFYKINAIYCSYTESNWITETFYIFDLWDFQPNLVYQVDISWAAGGDICCFSDVL